MNIFYCCFNSHVGGRNTDRPAQWSLKVLQKVQDSIFFDQNAGQILLQWTSGNQKENESLLYLHTKISELKICINSNKGLEQKLLLTRETTLSMECTKTNQSQYCVPRRWRMEDGGCRFSFSKGKNITIPSHSTKDGL